jgi:probable DNA repair protein
MAVTQQAEISGQIVAALERGATVLTPTHRAARALSRAYDDRQRTLGMTRWQPANVLPLESWLSTCWHALLVTGQETRLLLNATQEQAVWRAIVANRQGPAALDSLAPLAAEAWKVLNLHNGQQRLAEAGTSTDGKAFVRWAREFVNRCDRDGYLSAAELPRALERALAAGKLDLADDGLLLVDFDTLPPAHASLFAAIDRAGYPVASLTTASPASSRSLCRCADDADELRACALWLREQLERDPTRQLAVVVPNLGERREAIARAFHAVLPQSDRLFEFSLGYPLGQTALAAAALDLLRWPFQPLSTPQIGNLLVSPYLGATAQETLAAAEFDAFELRQLKTLRPELTLEATITRLLRSERHDRLHPVVNRLRILLAAAPTANPEARRTHAEWAELFRKMLEAAIPGPQADTELIRSWDSALDELATLDFDGTRPTAMTALETLKAIALKITFAPRSNEAPIQILGPLEVGGVTFDALWFLGADDTAWPPPAPPHPLLPWSLARELGIPGSDRQRDREAAQILTRRIASAAAEVVFSYAVQADGIERRASPALETLGLAQMESPLRSIRAPLPMLPFFDTTTLPPLPDQPISGGARLLELQAACAFRAFAVLRLFSTGLETRAPGLDPRDRGVLVHSVMEQFWKLTQDRASLKALITEDRNARLDRCIDRALAKAQESAETAWDHAYVHTQRQRLAHLLRPWLEVEAKRPDFAVFDQETVVREVALGALTLKSLRVDRIDITAGGPLILDYKTGLAEPKSWLTTRPEQPQLPLYAALAAERVALEEPLAGVAFAILRAGEELALKGFADDPRVLEKRSRMDAVSFAEQVANWREILVQLANDFAAGEAIVSPRDYPKTCTHCDQRILCRLDPATLAADDETDTEESNG